MTGSAVPADEDTTRDRALALAENALDRSRPDEALRRVADVLAYAPDDAYAWLIATRAHLSARHAPQAVDASGRLCALRPDTPVALRLRAAALAGVRDRAGAVAAAERALQLAPDEAWSHGMLAVVLSDLGGPRRRARDEAARAVALDPTDCGLHVVVANVALTQRRTRDARAAISRALELDPTDGDAIRLSALIDVADPAGTRTVRALQTQGDHLRFAPGEDVNLQTMGILARTFFSRVAAILAFGTLAVARLWYFDHDHPLDTVQPAAVLTVAIAVVYLVVTLARVDSAIRGYLGDVLRSPWLLGAAAGAAVALVSLAACAAWANPAAVAFVVPAGVGSGAALLLARHETGTFLRRHGTTLPAFFSQASLLGLGILFALLAAAAAAIAMGDPDVADGSERRAYAVVAAVLAALAALDLVAWRRRRRR